MLLSLILAWLAVAFTAITALKYIVRISKIKRLNRFFSRRHIPSGKLLILTGLLHGILAGNFASAGISDVMIAPVLFTWNWGTACFAAAIMLAASYYLLHKKFKKFWMPVHRVLTVAMIGLLAIHIVNVGIQIDDRIFPKSASDESALAVVDVSEESGAAASALPSDTDSTALVVSTPTSENSDTASEQNQLSSVIEETTALFSGAQLKDGTYEGSATGYNGSITVSVTVLSGQVTEITVLNESDTPQYFSRAESILNTIVSEQSLEVDAVSGATFSSAGLVNAVADALQNAVVTGDLSVAEYDLSAADKHHR